MHSVGPHMLELLCPPQGADAEDSGPRTAGATEPPGSNRTQRSMQLLRDAPEGPSETQEAVTNWMLGLCVSFVPSAGPSVTATASSAGPGECGSHSSPYLAAFFFFFKEIEPYQPQIIP